MHRPATRTGFGLLPLVACVILGACTGADTPVGPAQGSAPTLLISDAARGGLSGFYWLPPLVKQSATTGTSTGVFLPQVRVEVCDLGSQVPTAASACVGAPVATFTATTGTGGAVVRYDATAGLYQVNFDTKSAANGTGLQLDHYYRLRVLLGGPLLTGFADLDPVANGSELKNISTGDVVGLADGRTLPIKFRLETGAATPIGAAGGTVSTPDGRASVTFAPGAFGGDVSVRIAPTALAPADPDVVPGTTYEFLPSPVTFAAPTTLTLAYDPATIPGGPGGESNLVLVTATSTGWQEVPGSTVSPAQHTVSGPIPGFSKYGVGKKKSRPLYVANGNSNSITVYAAGAVGDAAPVTTIAGPSTRLRSPSAIVRDALGRLYVSNFDGNTVNIYAAGASGDAAPIATIEGPNAGLAGPRFLALDAAGRLYVSSQSSVTVYAPGASGDATPVASLGAPSGLARPGGVALDAAGRLYVGDGRLGGIVQIYAPISTDAPAPVATLQVNSGLPPLGMAVDGNGRLYVGGVGNDIAEYAPGATGAATPVATFAFGSVRAFAFDPTGRLYVADQEGSRIGIFTIGPTGAGTLTATIAGPSTGLQAPRGITF